MNSNDIDEMIANLDREKARLDAEVKMRIVFDTINAVLVAIGFIICSYWATGGH